LTTLPRCVSRHRCQENHDKKESETWHGEYPPFEGAEVLLASDGRSSNPLFATERFQVRGRCYIPPVAIDANDECAGHMVADLTFHAETEITAGNDGWICAATSLRRRLCRANAPTMIRDSAQSTITSIRFLIAITVPLSRI